MKQIIFTQLTLMIYAGLAWILVVVPIQEIRKHQLHYSIQHPATSKDIIDGFGPIMGALDEMIEEETKQ